MQLPKLADEVVAEATGQSHRRDPVEPRVGGPAGNAALTATTGLILLVLFLAELVTTLDVSGLLTWHVAIGTVLAPVALLKTASTGWRIVRYYTGDRPYRVAGPPPTLLRILGPLVVASTLGLLGTGLLLIALGPTSGQRPFVTVLGQGVDVLTLHQAAFLAFAVVTGLHVLARIYPALTLVTGRVRGGGPTRAVPGRTRRGVALLAVLAVGAVSAVLVVHADRAWQRDHPRFGRPPGASARHR